MHHVLSRLAYGTRPCFLVVMRENAIRSMLLVNFPTNASPSESKKMSVRAASASPKLSNNPSRMLRSQYFFLTAPRSRPGIVFHVYWGYFLVSSMTWSSSVARKMVFIPYLKTIEKIYLRIHAKLY
jgi:hypothetical protein